MQFIPESTDRRTQRTRPVLRGALILLVAFLIGWIIAEAVFSIRVSGVIIIGMIVVICLGTAFLLFPAVMWLGMFWNIRKRS